MSERDIPSVPSSAEPRSPQHAKLKRRLQSYTYYRHSPEGRSKVGSSSLRLITKDGVRFKNSFTRDKSVSEKSKALAHLEAKRNKNLRHRLPDTAPSNIEFQAIPSTSSTDISELGN